MKLQTVLFNGLLWFRILLVSASARIADAQQTADVIRGVVTGPDNRPVAEVQVTAVSFVGGVIRTRRTDARGRFSLVFPNGEGAYWVSFNAIGFQPRRMEVRRRADEDVLIADARLASQALETVTVSGGGARVSPPRSDNGQEISGVDAMAALLTRTPGDAGNLAAMVSATPGVQLIPGVDGAPDRFSIFGLAAEQSNITFNGLAQSISKLPRDASVSVQLRSGYDVSNGGASGATVAINTTSGTNYVVRQFSGYLNAAGAQINDRVGNVSQYSAVSLGGRMSGPISLDRNFYNLSFQFDQRAQDLSTAFSNTPEVFERAGIANDSVTRFRNTLGSLKVPYGTTRGSSKRTSGTLLSSIDWASKSPTSGQALTFAFNGSFTENGPPAISTLLAPSSLASSRYVSGGSLIRHTNYFGSGTLTETVLSISGSNWHNDPYEDLPAGRVLVNSTLSDGRMSTRSLTFGGNVNSSSTSNFSAGLRNTLSQFSGNNRHRFKLFSELRLDNSASTEATNLSGRFTYQSLADLKANRPSSYSRSLNAVRQNTSALVGALGLGDSWRVSPDLQIQYGVRMDGDRFLDRPQFNSTLKAALGVNNSNVPNRVYFSPRIGFSRTFGGDAEIYGPYGVYGYGQGKVLRGGIGLFQNVRGPDLISAAIINSGLPSGVQQVVCTGIATPVAQWDIMQNSAFQLPSQCTDGTSGSVFANSAPAVTLFGKNYAEEKSLRSTLNWSMSVLGARGVINGTGLLAFNFNQPDYIDVNFKPAQQFALRDEGDRPVFVAPGDIDAASGLVASRASRISSAFGNVSALQSGLRSRTAQLSLWISPYKYKRFYWTFNYSVQDTRQQYRGFSSTANSPFEIRSGVSAQPTHDLGLNIRYILVNRIVFQFDGRVQSGIRFTPIVAGDINGDGAFSERAFVFDPAKAPDASVATGMRGLLESGSDAARNCLHSHLGNIAKRNSCVGPWTVGASTLSASLNSLKVGLPLRATVSFVLSNPLGAADLVLHGSDKLHGWGQPQSIDQTLLTVNGFDVTNLRYKYNVNQRFGATSAQSVVARTPSVLTLKVGLNLAPRRDWQDLYLALGRGRNRVGAKMSEGAMRQYGSQIFPNPMAIMLRQGEYLHLLRWQADSLARMSRRYSRLVDSLWTPAAKRMAVLPKQYDQNATEAEFSAARNAALSYLLTVIPHMESMLTKGQSVVLSPAVSNYFNIPYLQSLFAGIPAFFSVSGTP